MILEETVLFQRTSASVWNPFCLRQLLNHPHSNCSVYVSLKQNSLVTEVSYNINTRNHYRNDLLHAMVDALNRHVSFPLHLSLICLAPSRYSLIFILNYYLTEEELQMIRVRVHCQDWEKRVVFSIVEMSDKVIKKMMELMGELEIKHSLSPKIFSLRNFVEKLADLDINMIVVNNGNSCEKCAIDMTAFSLADRY